MSSEAGRAKKGVKTILMVCSGNTCRSPMAEAIARGVADGLSGSEPGGGGGDGPAQLVFVSAGTGAMEGTPYSPETVEAVKKLGYAPPRGRSRPLDRAMLRSADAVWVMTRAHRTAVLSLEPSADGKVELLDPSGKDVSDPIGSPQSRYDEVARRMEMVIRERLRPREA